jgi:hypothetical protein
MLRILKAQLYTEQMHENLRTQKYFKLHNSRTTVDKIVKLNIPPSYCPLKKRSKGKGSEK